MDSLITAAARALAVGDALGALKRVALRDDPSALALRGIAMAQLGEHARARELLRRAARGFGAHEELARARCIVAEAEVALAMRDFYGSPRTLEAAAATLEAHADRANALHAHLIAVRRLLLLGRSDEAAGMLAQLGGQDLPSPLRVVAEIVSAELALRSLRTEAARQALARARDAAQHARVPALLAEVDEASAALDRPAARCVHSGREQTLRPSEIEALLASNTLVIDACRRGVAAGSRWQSLARRPVLLALLRALAEVWPGDIDRNELIAQGFRVRRPNESHRARLRVEISRLRSLIAPLACIEASARGFALRPQAAGTVAVLMPPIDGEQASLLAILADGAAWPTSALALALGASQRTVQRTLAELEAKAEVRSIGRARARRWLAAPLTGFTTNLLLPVLLPTG